MSIMRNLPRFSSVASLARRSRVYSSSPRRAISSAVNVGCGIIIASFQGIRVHYTDTEARLHRDSPTPQAIDGRLDDGRIPSANLWRVKQTQSVFESLVALLYDLSLTRSPRSPERALRRTPG